MRTLITGGAGFIGTNTADRLLSDGHQVIIVDDLSRRGSESNLQWLRDRHGDFPFHQVDVRDYAALSLAFREHEPLDLVLHFAAQVAVTTSVEDPRIDFEVNALGTLNVLEAVRAMDDNPVLLYTSTNKVYGALTQLQVVEDDLRYRYADLPLGVTEETPRGRRISMCAITTACMACARSSSATPASTALDNLALRIRDGLPGL
jgi:CDP-paratose 2-epimerase